MIDLVDLKKDIRNGAIKAYVHRGEVYLEDTQTEEAIIICRVASNIDDMLWAELLQQVTYAQVNINRCSHLLNKRGRAK